MKLNLRNVFKSISMAEIVAIVVFIIYIVVPISTPAFLAPYVESPLGMIVIFCIIVSLFLFTHPVVAILYLLVAYLLLRRSAAQLAPIPQSAYVQFTPTLDEHAAEIKQEEHQKDYVHPLPAEQPLTLEEDIVNKMAPIGKSEMPVFTPVSFKPVSANMNGASPI